MPGQTKKYYQVKGCNRTIRSGDIVFAFDPYMFDSGVWWGIYETSDSEEQDALDGMDWIYKLSKEEYDREIKKKHPSTSDFKPLPQPRQQRSKQIAIEGEGAEVVQNVPQESSGEKDKELTVEDIVKPAPVRKRTRKGK
tara:strand:- start:8467 stop:8883 length:417 start_codon:yes stop_codon:yes gene_type:complete